MTDHAVALTTHTTEMRQLREMNAVLARTPRRSRPTAGSLGVHVDVPEAAVLQRLRPAGPPSYPYVYGVFVREGQAPEAERPALVELHTAHLRAISDRLHLRGHIWGV
jgi:hypothetical protein